MFDDKFFERIDDEHERRRAEFEKLSLDPPCREVTVGSRVLCSAGLIGFGFDWERYEAVVIEVADTAYRVRFTERRKFRSDEPEEKWVHRAAITDVLNPKDSA